MNNSNSSTLFLNDATLIDDVRRIIIEINGEVDKEKIELLLNESIFHLEKNIDLQVVNELFTLIRACFSKYPKELMPIFNKIFDKSKSNANYIIITTELLYFYIYHENASSFIQTYACFVNESLNDLIPQIHNINNQNFSIFGHEIPHQFKLQLIFNLLLCSKLNETIVTSFASCIFSQEYKNFNDKYRHKMIKLIEKIINDGYANIISTYFTSNIVSIIDVKTSFFKKLIPFLPDELFTTIFSKDEEIIIKAHKLDHSIIVKIINQYQKLNLELQKKSIEIIINSLPKSEYTKDVLDYLKRFNFIYRIENGRTFDNFPDPLFLIKVTQNFEIIPNDIMKHKIYEITDINFFQRFIQSTNITFPFLSKSSFYIHVYSILANQKEKCNIATIKNFTNLFQKFIKIEHLNKTIDEIIFSKYPPNLQEVDFLINFIKSLKSDYYIQITNPKHIYILFNKLLSKKKIINHLFMQFFPTDIIYKLYLKKLMLSDTKTFPFLYYSIKFSKNNSKISDLIKLQISPNIDVNDINLSKFINENNYDLLESLNNESLLLASCALIFGENGSITRIDGLNKETIIPFYAIALRNWSKNFSKLFISKDMSDLFLNTFKLMINNRSPVIMASINSILIGDEKNKIPDFNNIRSQILNLLYNSLLKDEYIGDKTVVFSYLMSKINEFSIIRYDLNDLIRLVIQHLDEIDYKSLQHPLNLYLFNNIKIANLLSNSIENPRSSTELINTLYFINNLSYNAPALKIKNFDNLKQIALHENKAENILLIGNFLLIYKNSKLLREIINNYHFQVDIKEQLMKLIPYDEMNFDEIISLILSTENLEKNDTLMNTFLHKLKDNKTLNKHFLLIIAQSFKYTKSISFTNVIQIFSKRFSYINLYAPLIRAINTFHEKYTNKNEFIQRAKINETEFLIDFSNLNLESSYIKHIFDSINHNNKSYNSFLCLKNIANTFPFLLEQNPNLIFESVYPNLDNISIVFDNDNDDYELEKEQMAKTSISAFSFLISSLHSTKIMDAFAIWYFQNVQKFNNYQIFCFNFIFLSILKNSGLRHVLISSLLNNNFIEILSTFYQRDIQNGIFKKNYFKMIYKVVKYFYKSLNNFSPIDVISIDELRKTKEPFYHEFDHYSTIYPLTFGKITKKLFINAPCTKLNNKIFNYIENIEKEKINWINYNMNDKIPNQNVRSSTINLFIDNYNKILKPKKTSIAISNSDISKLPKVSTPISVEMARYILNQPSWIYEWIINDKHFPINEEHYDMLNDTITKLNEIKSHRNENDKLLYNFDIANYFQQQYNHKSLFKILIDKALSYKPTKHKLRSPNLNTNYRQLVENIIHNKNILNTFLNLITEKLSIILEKSQNGINTYKSVENIISFLSYIEICDGFNESFPDICLDKLIDIFLEQQYRQNEKMLNQLLCFLIETDIKKASNRFFELIRYIFLLKKDDFTLDALKICSKFNIINNDHLEIVKDVFIKEINKNDPSSPIILEITKLIPLLGKSYHNELINLLSKLFKKANQKKKKIDTKSKDLINTLLNILTPDRNKDISIEIYDSIKDNESSLQPIPQLIYNSDSTFWQLFEQNRITINNLLENMRIDFLEDEMEEEDQEEEEEHEMKEKNLNLKSKLLNEYPELFSFKIRYKLFNAKMNRKINNCYVNNINIDPENVLHSSYNQLFDKKPEKWKYRFHINYLSEIGIDQGGLRRDWFIRLSRELFNPDYGLFHLSENCCYQPSRLSYANQDHLKFFKFTGMIIARALLQGDNIDAHLSHSFLRQILHHKVLLIDIKDIDESIYNSLQYIINNDVETGLYFEIDKEDYGTVNTHELIENGSETKVTNENKSEFVDLMVNYYTKNSIEQQINAFCDGFNSIIPYNDIKIFSPNELDLLICGISNINVDELKNNAMYIHPYKKDSQSVKLFFESIAKWNNSELQKLLFFITGSSRIPANKVRKITIQPGGNKNRLPVAHTCSFTLDLPRYETEDQLNEKFKIALDEKSFQLV